MEAGDRTPPGAPPPPPASSIAAERVGPGPSSWSFRAVVAILTVGSGLLMFWLSGGLPDDAEGGLAAGDDPWARLVSDLGLDAARAVSSAASGLALGLLALAGRRLLHSELAGLLAAVLLGLDPAFLLWGQTALPHATLMALLLGAVWLLLLPRPALHWVGSGSLAAAAFLEPWTLLWSVPLALLVLVRGHIYASASHLGVSVVQGLAIPAAAAGAGWLAGGPGPGCLRGSWPDELSLGRVLEAAPDQVALHNPVLWFAGLGAAVALAAAAVLRVALQFRLARLPGRVQIRLPEPIPPTQARTLWLLALVILAPHPAVLWPLLALAFAAGVADLGRDAPGFGLALATAALAFGGLYLGQNWAEVAGGAGEFGPFALVPWGAVEGC